jgi:hypothetical protein
MHSLDCGPKASRSYPAIMSKALYKMTRPAALLSQHTCLEEGKNNQINLLPHYPARLMPYKREA